MYDRRRFLQALSALGLGAVSPARAQVFNPKPRFASSPFTLGVASGCPRPDMLTLWTRLAPVPDAPGRSRTDSLANVTVDTLRAIAAGEVLRPAVTTG